MTVKHNVVAVGKDSLDLAGSVWVTRPDPGKKLLQALHPGTGSRTIMVAFCKSPVQRKPATRRNGCPSVFALPKDIGGYRTNTQCPSNRAFLP